MSQHRNGSWETNPPGRQTGKGPTVSPVLGLTHRHSRLGLRLPGAGACRIGKGFLGDSVPKQSGKRSRLMPGRAREHFLQRRLWEQRPQDVNLRAGSDSPAQGVRSGTTQGQVLHWRQGQGQ